MPSQLEVYDIYVGIKHVDFHLYRSKHAENINFVGIFTKYLLDFVVFVRKLLEMEIIS